MAARLGIVIGLYFLLFSCSSNDKIVVREKVDFKKICVKDKSKSIWIDKDSEYEFLETKMDFTGSITSYFDDGKIDEIKNFNGSLPHGKHLEYYSNGMLHQVEEFEFGKRVGRIIFKYDNGVICGKFKIRNGQINDTSVMYTHKGDSMNLVGYVGDVATMLEEYHFPNKKEQEKYFECMDK